MKCPEGVYVHALGGSCTLKGARAYDWLSRLAPYLTGERTLEELVGPLPDDQRSMVTELVGTLSEQRFVVDVVGDEPHQLDAEEQRVYAAEIAFIGYGLDSAQWRFQRVRQARITLVGAGSVVGALLAAGLWSGWCAVRVFAPAEELAALEQVVAAARRDSKQSVGLRPWPEASSAEIVGGADVVLQVCDVARRADLIALSRVCAGAGTVVGQVLLCADEAWLTAVGAPEVVEAESCWRRLDEWRGEDDAVGGWLTGPVPDIIAAQLVLSCFSYLSGLDALRSPERAAQPPVLTRVDLRALVTRTHRVRPHPVAGPRAAQTEADARAWIEELAGAAPVAVAELLERSGAVVDARTGLLGTLDEEELTQVPLSVCRASVSDPYGVLPPWAPAPVVTGWGEDRPTARLRALLAALATYGSLSAPVAERRWGLDLVSGALRPVPPEVVHPARREVPYQAPVGAAAGRCWSDAIAAGLRAHCEALLTGHSDGPPLDADEVTDEHARYLLRLLHAAGRQLTVTDLSGVLGLPAFAFRADADPDANPVLTCAATQAEAVRDGLERTVLRWQAHKEGLSLTSPTRWPVELDEPRAGGPGDDPRCRVLTEALCRAGQVPLAVPLTPDREARTVLPYVVQVVLCHD